MISNFFVLSPRGDTIITKTYRTRPNVGAHERSHLEAFFRRIKFWNDASTPAVALSGDDQDLLDGGTIASPVSGLGGGDDDKKSDPRQKVDAPPVFIMSDGLSYLHVKRNGLIFGCSTSRNVSPTTVIEILSKIAKVFKDYCGTLSEEAIRKNFILLYELLDEMMDYGYPQVTQTENLKAFVYNEPILVSHVPSTGNMINPKTASASAVHKPIINSVTATGGKKQNNNQKNEIFVDILERLNVLYSANGYLLNSTIDGCIQMKSYLSGNPELRLALNEDLIIGKNTQTNPNYGAVVLDDINFNACVNLSEFEHGRTLSFYPPDGEFIVLNYRLTGEFRAPFRIFPTIEETPGEPNKIEINIHVRAEMPDNHFGANVCIEIPLPRNTVAASCNVVTSGTSNVTAEYSNADRKILWQLKKFPGSSEQTLRSKVTFSSPCTSQVRKEIGPISMNFEIPMYNVSQLQVRYLRIAESMPGYTPYRWVRYVTQSSSYACRL